jgi:hypothetical protein
MQVDEIRHRLYVVVDPNPLMPCQTGITKIGGSGGVTRCHRDGGNLCIPLFGEKISDLTADELWVIDL